MSDVKQIEEKIETTVSDVNDLRKKVRVEVSAEAVDDYFDEAAGKLMGTVTLPGFRRGRVPQKMIERRFHKEILSDVIRSIYTETTMPSIEKSGLKTIGEPDFDVPDKPEDVNQPKRGEAFVYEFETDIEPEFDVPEYKGLKIEQPEIEVFDSEIEQELEYYRNQFGSVKDIEEGEVKRGDRLKCAVKVLIDDSVEYENDAAFVSEMAKDGAFVIEEFSHDITLGGLLKMNVGESRTIKHQLDDSVENEAWRGKTVTVELTVNLIRRHTPAELTDELISKEGLADSLDALKNAIRERRIKQLEETTENATEGKLIDALIEKVDFDLPEKTLAKITTELENRAFQQLYQYLVYMQRTPTEEEMERIKQDAAQSARRMLKADLILNKIAKAENITVDDADVDEEVFNIARKRKVKASDLFDEMRSSGELEQIKMRLSRDLVVEFLKANAEIDIVPRQDPATVKDDDSKKDAADGDQSEDNSEKPADTADEGAADEKPEA